MAWTSDSWKQNDSIFYGYPTPISTSAPEPVIIPDFSHPWIFNDEDFFYGYPHHKLSLLAPEAPIISEFGHPWIFDDLFYGYPHTLNLIYNPLRLIVGTTPVQRVYSGVRLVWEKDSNINDIIPGIEAN